MLSELLRLLAILNTGAGQLAFAAGLALGLSAMFLLAGGVALWLTVGGRVPREEPPSIRLYPLEFPMLLEFTERR